MRNVECGMRTIDAVDGEKRCGFAAIPHSSFIIPHFLMVDDKVIGDGAMLFLGRIGVGSEGRQQSSLFGLLTH